MDPEVVLLNNFEAELDEVDLEENIEAILDQVYTIENPDYQQDKEEELQDYMKSVEKIQDEKNKRRKKKKAPIKEALLKTENPIPENMPTGGSVDFSKIPSNEG